MFTLVATASASGLFAYHLLTNSKDGGAESKVQSRPTQAPDHALRAASATAEPKRPAPVRKVNESLMVPKQKAGFACGSAPIAYNSASRAMAPVPFNAPVRSSMPARKYEDGSSSMRDTRLFATGYYGDAARSQRGREFSLRGGMTNEDMVGKRGELPTSSMVFTPQTGMPDDTRERLARRGTPYDISNGYMNDALPGPVGIVPGKNYGHIMDKCIGAAPARKRGFIGPVTMRGILGEDGNFGKTIADPVMSGLTQKSAVQLARERSLEPGMGSTHHGMVSVAESHDDRSRRYAVARDAVKTLRGSVSPWPSWPA